jgi:hypothetical protein
MVIKFYYNGIKVGGGKLIKCWYSVDNNKDNAPEVRITAKDYDAQLPKELNPENNTDYMTDYFDKDRASITPESPYYKQARAAALVLEIKRLRRSIESDTAYYARRGQTPAAYIEQSKIRLAGYEKEFSELTA